MKPLEALAEDLRRLGVAAIIAGLVGGFLEDNIPGVAAVMAAILGVLLLGVGYWAHHRTEKRQ
jgi:hypothetical protein